MKPPSSSRIKADTLGQNSNENNWMQGSVQPTISDWDLCANAREENPGGPDPAICTHNMSHHHQAGGTGLSNPC